MLEDIHLNIAPGVFSDDLPEPARKYLTNLVSEIEGSLDTLQAHTFESIRQMEEDILNNSLSQLDVIQQDLAQIKKDIANVNATRLRIK